MPLGCQCGDLMNVQSRNVLVTFRHPQNVHPTQCPRFHYIHCDILSPEETCRDLCPPSPGSGHDVAKIKQPSFFIWIVTKHPLCDSFPACFTTSLFPHCDICIVPVWHFPFFDTCPPSHLPILWHWSCCVTITQQQTHPLPFPPLIVYLHSMYSMCVYRNCMIMLQSSQQEGGR